MKLNIPKTDRERVVVVGGGFAGLSLLKELANTKYQVVLIDKTNVHEFQPLLYQVATAAISPGDIAFPFRKLLRGKKRDNIHFRMAELQGVDPAKKVVKTDRGALEYDYLVLAMGAVTNFFGIESVKENAMQMKTLSQALEIRNTVLYNIEQAVQIEDHDRYKSLLNVVIVGGGAAGVELAGAFAEMKRYIVPKDYPEIDPDDFKIYLFEGSDRLLGVMSDKTSEETLKILTKRGVDVELGRYVVDYKEGEVVLKDGEKIPTENFIWTSGVTVELPKGMEKASTNRAGRIETDEYLRMKGYDSIYVVGDASLQVTEDYPNGYPQLARVAMEQAQHVGKSLCNIAKGREEKPYKYINYPMMATVGRNRAFAEIGPLRLKGFLAWISWTFVHIIFILGVRNKFNVLWNWFWNYVAFDLPTRIIVTPTKPRYLMDSKEFEEVNGGE